MRSNTKISKSTKSALNAELMKFANKVYSFDFVYNEEMGITVLIVQPFKNANVCHIATSIMSPDEKKFRKSVGRFYAYMNYQNGKYIDSPATINVSIFDHI